MLAKLPDETTQLLIDLCSGIDMEDTPDQPEPELTKPIERPNQGGASYLTRLAGNRASMLFTGDMNLNFTSPPPPVSNPSSDSTEREKENKTGQHLRRSIFDAGRLETITDSPSTATADIPLTKSRFNPKRPSPKQYFAHFVDHTDQFIKFLEAVAWNRWGQMVTTDRSSSARGDGASSSRDSVSDDAAEKRDQTAIWNTLLELYLTVSATTTNTALATTSRNKALQLLNHHDTLPYDPIHALIVCSTRSFMDGLVLLWEQMGMYEDVLRYWMDRENEGDVETVSGERPSVRVLHYLKLYGTTHPYLYPLVLRFLTSTPALLNRHTTDLTKILAHIDKERIMPPLGVIQVLSRNDVASVGLVKQWLIGRITESREEIDAVSLPLLTFCTTTV